MFKKNKLYMILLIAVVAVLFTVLMIKKDPVTEIQPSHYYILTSDDPLKSKVTKVETFNKLGEIVDMVILDTELAWHTKRDDDYIHIFGSRDYYIINIISGEILYIEATNIVEGGDIVGDNLYFMTNDGFDRETMMYKSTINHIKLDGKKIYTKEDFKSLNSDKVPKGIITTEDKVYFLTSDFELSSEKNFLQTYDLNLILLKEVEISHDYEGISAEVNNEILLNSSTGYLFYPSMKSIKSQEEFSGYPHPYCIGNKFIKTQRHDGYRDIIIETINSEYELECQKVQTSEKRVNVCSVISDNKFSIEAKSDKGNIIQFYNINDKTYDAFEYSVKDGDTVNGAYSIN